MELTIYKYGGTCDVYRNNSNGWEDPLVFHTSNPRHAADATYLQFTGAIPDYSLVYEGGGTEHRFYAVIN